MHSAHQIGGILGDQIDSSFGLGRQNHGSLFGIADDFN